MAEKKSKSARAKSTASLGFEAKLIKSEGDYAGANPEDPDEYKAENVSWVPAELRWSRAHASSLKYPAAGAAC